MGVRMLLAMVGLVMLMAGCASQQSVQETQPSVSDNGSEVFRGTLPCRSCSGIDITLSLNGDVANATEDQHTYTLDAVYRKNANTSEDATGSSGDNQHYTGSWDELNGTPTNADAKVLQLTPDEGTNKRIYYFMRIDPNTLELISPDLYRYENGDMLRLKR